MTATDATTAVKAGDVIELRLGDTKSSGLPVFPAQPIQPAPARHFPRVIAFRDRLQMPHPAASTAFFQIL